MYIVVEVGNLETYVLSHTLSLFFLNPTYPLPLPLKEKTNPHIPFPLPVTPLPLRKHACSGTISHAPAHLFNGAGIRAPPRQPCSCATTPRPEHKQTLREVVEEELPGESLLEAEKSVPYQPVGATNLGPVESN